MCILFNGFMGFLVVVAVAVNHAEGALFLRSGLVLPDANRISSELHVCVPLTTLR